MTVPETEPVHNPQSPEPEPEAKPSGFRGTNAHTFTPDDKAKARAQTQVMNKLRRGIEASARKGLEALLVERPEVVELEVGELARLAATRITVDLVAGTVPGSQLHYAAQAVRTLVEVARLEAGKPTDVTARITAGASDLAELLGSVRREARAALAATDGGAPIDVDSALDQPSDRPDEA